MNIHIEFQAEQINELKKKLKSGSKKSKGKTKKMQQTLDRLRKQDKTENSARVQYNFPAIDLLYDAQSNDHHDIVF